MELPNNQLRIIPYHGVDQIVNDFGATEAEFATSLRLNLCELK
jgi:hypothetical protein